MRSGQHRKYNILTRILDEYVREGKSVSKRQRFFNTDTEERANQARSRAFIHLYLSATYGMVDFEDREHVITDDSNDAGIDAYYIDAERKIIDIIQAKFRSNPSNFESKYIAPEELLSIDLDNVLRGSREDSDGKKYNGYIQILIDKISDITDIARYKTKVTILANVKPDQESLVNRLFPGDDTEIINFEKCYSNLVLPTIRGEQHYTESMRLQIDLSNKSGASRLSAEISTAHGSSEVTVVLVPTLEIAQLMSRYKNSILRYNPRSYLEFREQRTNEGIKNSITKISTGEFAILNNGITVVSDETYVNERVGAKNKAQIEIVNPQIINGGQTAFTLSRIYDESSDIDRSTLFEGKEIVVRIITLPQIEEEKKKELILSISSATNSQTTVSAIDRSASNDSNRELAEKIFLRTGLLYEPKRGEYSDSIYRNYISKDDVVERSIFTRLMHIAMGDYALAVKKRVMRNTGGIIPEIGSEDVIDRFIKLHEIYAEISSGQANSHASATIANDLSLTVLCAAVRQRSVSDGNDIGVLGAIEQSKQLISDFEGWAKDNATEFIRKRTNKTTGEVTVEFSRSSWKKSNRYAHDVEKYAALLELR
jgi:hypothetical protein